ncbi:MAG TPA: RidA family protein [Candidatus Polarisedimenticolia bacterium]|jgi:2-iminobutanoate/2-iminopropanoate deaminase|nr:RidA family protein [Candidatus Polarisedimenticolia bacterium]
MPTKKAVRTERAPAAIGPYSQGMAAAGFLFVSGQVPLDPSRGEMVSGEIEEQVERVLENLKAILESGGAALGSVVKTTVYLADLGDFARMNEVYARFFGADPPARSTVEVSGLPRGARVEIDAIALLD